MYSLELTYCQAIGGPPHIWVGPSHSKPPTKIDYIRLTLTTCYQIAEVRNHRNKKIYIIYVTYTHIHIYLYICICIRPS